MVDREFSPRHLNPQRKVRVRMFRGPRGHRVWRDRRPGKRWSRRFRWVAIVIALVMVIGAGGGYGYVEYFNHRIHRFKEAVVTPRTESSPSTNYLITGVDSRADAPKGSGVGDTATTPGSRTDTMMLIHVSKNTKKVTIVSFPRDSRVLIPGHGFYKLNAATGLGGPTLLVQTIESIAQIHIDHYVQIDFAGFVAMTNALGGVNVCLTEPAQDSFTGINLTAGEHHLNGLEALAYVRQRHGLPGEDLDRIKRQQRFIGAMVRKVDSARTLFDPIRLTRFLSAATGSVELDRSLTLGGLKSLATKLRSLDPQHVEFESIPITGTANMHDAIGVENDVLLDDAKILPFFAAIESDSGVGDIVGTPTPTPTPTTSASVAPSPTPTGPAALTVAPGNIKVKVLNGTGIAGKAHDAADSLASRGFSISGTGNASTDNVVTTVIRYAPEKVDSARTLAAAIPGAQLQISATAGDVLTVIIGKNYTGTRAVSLGATPSGGALPSPFGSGDAPGPQSQSESPSSSSASPSPSPTPVTAANNTCGV